MKTELAANFVAQIGGEVGGKRKITFTSFVLVLKPRSISNDQSLVNLYIKKILFH